MAGWISARRTHGATSGSNSGTSDWGQLGPRWRTHLSRRTLWSYSGLAWTFARANQRKQTECSLPKHPNHWATSELASIFADNHKIFATNLLPLCFLEYAVLQYLSLLIHWDVLLEPHIQVGRNITEGETSSSQRNKPNQVRLPHWAFQRESWKWVHANVFRFNV